MLNPRAGDKNGWKRRSVSLSPFPPRAAGAPGGTSEPRGSGAICRGHLARQAGTAIGTGEGARRAQQGENEAQRNFMALHSSLERDCSQVWVSLSFQVPSDRTRGNGLELQQVGYLGKILHQKVGQALDDAAQSSDGVIIPGSVQKPSGCGT